MHGRGRRHDLLHLFNFFPGRRLYFSYNDIPRVLNGLGISIISTSKGLMKDADCRRNKAGGELICNVW